MSTPETPQHRPPVPRYGEYAPAPTQPQPYVPQPYGAGPASYQPAYGARPLRTGDLIASVVLLSVGGISVLIAVVNALTIGLQMNAVYEQYGISGTYTAGAGAAIAAAVIIISHLVLYAIAVILSIVLIRRRRISFWLPLTAGAIASVIFFAAFMVLMFADPAIIQMLTEQSQP